jgi:LysM repeat protein/uncharacterized protein YvpB
LAVLILLIASTAAGAATKVYSIVYGDTLNHIAAEHGTDLATLIGLNDIDDPDLIIAGDALKVPDGELTTYTVRDGDTLANIAAAHGVAVDELAAVNKIDDVDLITVGDMLLIYMPVDGADATTGEDATGSESSEDASDTEASEDASDAESSEDADDESAEAVDDSESAEPDDASADEGAQDEAEANADESQSGRLHLVRDGETLADVATLYEVTVEQLIAANALETGEISAGMILKIPLASTEGVELIGMPTVQEQWPLMSELAAASVATAYWGAPVSASELLEGLERSENPHLGFRGDPQGMFGTTDDYGVYNTPLAAALNAYGFSAEAFYADGDRTALTARIDAGLPVVVWVTHNLAMQERIVVESDLGRYSLIPEKHAVVVYGYDDASVRVIDVGSGSSAVWAWDDFMASWALFDGMALAVDLE